MMVWVLVDKGSMFGVVGGLDRVSWGNDFFIGKITANWLFLAKGIVNSHLIDIAGCKCMHDRFPTVFGSYFDLRSGWLYMTFPTADCETSVRRGNVPR